MILTTLLIAITLQSAPIAPPTAQAGADCSRPVYATDQLVCDNPALVALDRRMADLLKRLPAERLSGRWLEDQSAWFRRSRMCAFKTDHARCVAAAYRERIAVLNALLQPTPSGAGPCVISNNSATDGRLAMMIVGGNVAAVAIVSERAWQSFVSLEVIRRTYVLRDMGGKLIIRCPLVQN